MNYELAKQLKDAGFEQRFVGADGLGKYVFDEHTSLDGVYAPTLEELIEACLNSGGYPKFSLESAEDPREWRAQLWSLADCPFANGSTPTEAVAKLWLALNKK